MNDDAIDWTFRPADLQGVNEAFAVYVTGSSMSPKYEDGDLVYVHPNRPVKRGRYYLIETSDNNAYIKRFEQWDGDTLVATQHNPAKELRFEKANLNHENHELNQDGFEKQKKMFFKWIENIDNAPTTAKKKDRH